MQDFTVELLASEISGLPRVVIGRGFRPQLNADTTFLIRVDGKPHFTVDLFPDAEEYRFRTSAIIWQKWAVFGYGQSVSFVSCISRFSCSYSSEFGSGAYFCEFYQNSDYLLVATGNGLIRFNSRAAIEWIARDLAIDGVVIDDVEDGIIRGAGEWDPPGGWLPFQVDLATGLVLERGG